jgi:hypothetical protein
MEVEVEVEEEEEEEVGSIQGFSLPLPSNPPHRQKETRDVMSTSKTVCSASSTSMYVRMRVGSCGIVEDARTRERICELGLM